MNARVWVWCGLLSVLVGCAGPRFIVRTPPSLPRELPQAPAVPEAREVRAALSGPHHQVTAARPLPDLRTQTIALVVLGPEDSRSATMVTLPRMLIGARLTRVVYPLAMQQVQGTFERGSAGAERTTVTGALHQLALLQARTPADQMVLLEVRGPIQEEQVTERRFEVPAQDLEAYRRAWEEFREALTALRGRMTSAAIPFRNEVLEARQSYEARGGQYREREDQETRERVEGWFAQLALLESTAAARERSARSPEEVQAQAAQQRPQERRQSSLVELRAVVTDLRVGETYWLDEVRAEGPSPAEAMQTALSLLLRDLTAGAALSGPSPESVPPSNSAPGNVSVTP